MTLPDNIIICGKKQLNYEGMQPNTIYIITSASKNEVYVLYKNDININIVKKNRINIDVNQLSPLSLYLTNFLT
jgi:hypothetical protein